MNGDFIQVSMIECSFLQTRRDGVETLVIMIQSPCRRLFLVLRKPNFKSRHPRNHVETSALCRRPLLCRGLLSNMMGLRLSMTAFMFDVGYSGLIWRS